MVEQMAEMSRKMMESITTMQKINDRTVQDLAKQQLEAAEGFISTGSRQMRELSGIGSLQDAVSAQAEIASELGTMMVDNAKRTMEVLSRGQNDLKVLIEKNVGDLMASSKVESK